MKILLKNNFLRMAFLSIERKPSQSIKIDIDGLRGLDDINANWKYSFFINNLHVDPLYSIPELFKLVHLKHSSSSTQVDMNWWQY